MERLPWGRFYNTDAVEGARGFLEDESVDLIITDPPYGIEGGSLHGHYNRDEGFVVPGYIEVAPEEYGAFSRDWIAEAERVLRPGGSLYVVSGYTNLYHLLAALRETSLEEMNHIIWKYNFGVYTRRKFVSSHYHILYYAKPGGERTFNLSCRFGPGERDESGRSLNYRDREDVWVINREYKPGRTKNKNELPRELLVKMMQYSSNRGDLVCDFFLGGFSTADVAAGLDRRFVGFEVSEEAFQHGLGRVRDVEVGHLLAELREPDRDGHSRNRGKPWSPAEERRLLRRYREMRESGVGKLASVEALREEFGRGRFALENVLRRLDAWE